MNPRRLTGDKRRYFVAYTLIFLVGYLFVFSPFWGQGTTYIWTPDGRTQHYPVLVYVGRYLRRMVRNILSGDFSIQLFDISIGLGDDVIGFLNSLWGTDPLLLLSAFVPVKNSEGLYGFLVALRLYLAGLSFLYLCGYFNKCKIYSLIGSVIYCFCGYAIHCSMRHPGFVNPMVILPLLVVGTEKALKRESLYLLIFSAFYAALCGYYHLYMMTIMLGLYVLIRLFDLFKTSRIRNFALAIGRVATGYGLGIGLSAIIFFPAVFQFLNAGRAGSSNYQGSYAWPYYRTRLLRFIAPVGSWDDMAFAAIVLFAMVLIYSSKKHATSKKLLTIALAFYLTSIGGLIMNGFQYSSNRWTFGLALIMAYVVVEMLPDLMDMDHKKQFLCIAVICLYSFFALSFASTRKLTYVLVGAVNLAFTALVLMTRRKEADVKLGEDARNVRIRNIAKPVICLCLVVMNVGINGIYKFAPDQGNYVSSFAKSGYEVERLENVIEREGEPYLLGNPDGRLDSSLATKNSAMPWSIPGMLIFYSSENRYVTDFWKEVENSGNITFFDMDSTDQRTIINTLLSEKIHVENEKSDAKVPFGYKKIEDSVNGSEIYKNSFALPWGYTYESTIPYDTLDKMNGLEKQEAMLQAVALDHTETLESDNTITFDEYAIPYEVNCKNCKWEDGGLVVSKANATITLTFDLPANVEGYIRLKGFDINTSNLASFAFTVKCGNVSKTSWAESERYTWYFGRENYLFNLGYSDEERTSLTITFSQTGTFRLDDIELYALPMENYPERVETLRAEPLENIQWGTNSLTGTVDLSKDKILCVSVPYSKGWTATVDGEKVEILRGNYMFMCLPLTAGHHDIEFHYCSPGLKLGAVLSAVSVCVVIGMLVYDRRKRGAVK